MDSSFLVKVATTEISLTEMVVPAFALSNLVSFAELFLTLEELAAEKSALALLIMV
jgi:hypothetical protein